MTGPVRRALEVNQAMLALGNEVFEADGATFVRNRATPKIRDGNHVARVRASTPEAIDRLLARVEREYEGFGHRRFEIDLDTPPEFEARLAYEGYEPGGALVMLLEEDLAGEPKPHDIRPVETEAAWRDYEALQQIDWEEYAGSPEERRVGGEMFRHRRIKAPPMRYWMAYVDGEPRAFTTSWEGIDGMGQVEMVFTHPDFRHRGLATALIRHCVADARAHGAGPIVIVADPDDTPKQMYAALGFRPIALKRSYLKRVEVPSP